MTSHPALRDERIHLQKNTLINPRRHPPLTATDSRLYPAPAPPSQFLLACWHSPYTQSSRGKGEKKKKGDKKQTRPHFFSLVCLLSQIVSVDWYKHWLTWADDYNVYGTHMLALVSLINPIRSFGKKSRLIHITFHSNTGTHAHTHTQAVAFSQDGSVFLWKCQTRDGSCLLPVPLLVLHPLS